MAGAGLNSRHRFAANTVGLRMCLPIHARGIADSKGAHSVVYLDDVVSYPVPMASFPWLIRASTLRKSSDGRNGFSRMSASYSRNSGN